MITQYDETGNSMLTNTPVNKPAGVTTVQSLASQYRNALTERARRAKELRTPAGFGAPGYWWRGYTPYVAPGGVAAPVMTAGNGAGMPSTYSGVTGAEPTPTVDPTIDPTVDPTIDPTIDPNIAPIEEPVVETTPAAGKAGLYSMAAPAWAKKYENESQKKQDTPGENWGNLPGGFVQGNQNQAGFLGWVNGLLNNFDLSGLTEPGMMSPYGPGWNDFLNTPKFQSDYNGWKDMRNKKYNNPYRDRKLPTSIYHRSNAYPKTTPSNSGTSTSGSSGGGYASGLWGGGGGGYGGGGGGYNPYNNWNWNLINWNVR